MKMRRHLAGVVATAMFAAAMALPAVASAHEGEFAKFDNCPSTNAEVVKCIYAVTESGEVVLGNKKVPVVNPVTLQGGLSKPSAGFRTMFAATNGETLTKTPQPVPGGLAGIVNCKEISNWFVRFSCELVFENGLTGLNATLELAAPATSIKLNTENLIFEEGTALQLPVKVHLENPFLGSECYVGSNASPIVVPLTTGTSGKLKGTSGEVTFNKLFDRTIVTGSKLVNNTIAAPGATGCGGAIVELILDPIINAQIGLPAASGTNAVSLNANLETGAARSVRASE